MIMCLMETMKLKLLELGKCFCFYYYFIETISFDRLFCCSRFNAKVNLHSPNLPTKYPDQEREQYKATREKMDDSNLTYRKKK